MAGQVPAIGFLERAVIEAGRIREKENWLGD
jgi:hypothetical protein